MSGRHSCKYESRQLVLLLWWDNHRVLAYLSGEEHLDWGLEA